LLVFWKKEERKESFVEGVHSIHMMIVGQFFFIKRPCDIKARDKKIKGEFGEEVAKWCESDKAMIKIPILNQSAIFSCVRCRLPQVYTIRLVASPTH